MGRSPHNNELYGRLDSSGRRTTVNTYWIDEWCDVWEDLLEVCGQPGRISAEVLNKLVYINVIYNCY